MNRRESEHRVSLQPAYILHAREYRETSRILEVFSYDYGRVSLVAKGSRGPRSRLQGMLQLFCPLLMSWTGQGELQTLTHAELNGKAIALTGRRAMSGYYLNELLLRLMTKHDPHPLLFDYFAETLQRLSSEDEEPVLRRFEVLLLQETGYGLNLEYDMVNDQPVVADQQYAYHMEQGPVRLASQPDAEFSLSGQTLIELANDALQSKQSLREAKFLMRRIIDAQLGNKPLKSRAFHWFKSN